MTLNNFRRVYDALNVLMAMNIISKEKKEIRWLGLPTNSVQEANSLEMDKEKRMDRIKAKTQQLQDLILQVCLLKKIISWLVCYVHMYSSSVANCLQKLSGT